MFWQKNRLPQKNGARTGEKNKHLFLFSTIAAAMAICKGIAALKKKKLSVKPIQEYNK